MKIFITGASGFVGGAAVAQLKGIHEFSCMSRSETADEKINAVGGTPVRCSLGDVREEHLAGVEAVVHSAAYVEAWGPWKIYWDMNVHATTQLRAKTTCPRISAQHLPRPAFQSPSLMPVLRLARGRAFIFLNTAPTNKSAKWCCTCWGTSGLEKLWAIHLSGVPHSSPPDAPRFNRGVHLTTLSELVTWIARLNRATSKGRGEGEV